MPSTNGASNSARNWRPACCRWWKARRMPQSARCLDGRPGAPYPRHCAERSRGGRHQGHSVRQGRHAGRFPERPGSRSATCLALQAAGGDRARADRLLAERRLRFRARCFRGEFGVCGRHQCRHRGALVPGGERRRSARTLVAELRRVHGRGRARPKSVALPGSTEAIASLHGAGFRLGVATNNSTSGAEKTLLALGVAQMFDAAYGYDAVANPKPAPDAILAFCDLTGLQTVGDRHGRRQPPRSRNGEGRRRRAGRRRAVGHRHARNAGAAGRRRAWTRSPICRPAWPRRPKTPEPSSGGLIQLPQLPPQDLADRCVFGSSVRNSMCLRALVAREVLLAVGVSASTVSSGILLDHEQLRHLAGMLVRHADRRHFEHARVPARQPPRARSDRR